MFDSFLCLGNWSVICTVTLCYVLHQIHSEFWYNQRSVFSGRYRHIQSYSALLRHIHAYWDIIKAYSELFRHIQRPEYSHIHNLAIFWALAYLEPDAYLKLCETLTRHIQNPATEHYSAIFRHYWEPCATLAYAETWHTRNSGIFRTLPQLHPDAYSEPCHIYEKLRIFRTLTYLKPNTYSKPSQRFKMEFFAKIVQNYNYFSKALLLDLWPGSEYACLRMSAH